MVTVETPRPVLRPPEASDVVPFIEIHGTRYKVFFATRGIVKLRLTAVLMPSLVGSRRARAQYLGVDRRAIRQLDNAAVANERGQILDCKRYGRASFQRFLETRPPLS